MIFPCFSGAKRLKFITSVTTNCICFPERAGELNGLVDLLHFSLDADSATLHNKLAARFLRQSHGEHSCRIIEQSRSDILFTYTNENINSFAGVYELCQEKQTRGHPRSGVLTRRQRPGEP